MQASAFLLVIPSVLLVLMVTQIQSYNISDNGVLDVSDYGLGSTDNITDLSIDTSDDTDDNLVDIDGDTKAPIDAGRRKVIGAPFIRVPPHPVTARAGARVVLHCLAEGDPPPKIYWHSNRAGRLDKLGTNSIYMNKNEILVNKNMFSLQLFEDHKLKMPHPGHNYKVYDNGTLEFISVEKDDEAGYKCKAKNMYGVANSSMVEVVVESPPQIMESPENIHVTHGEKLELQCSATGDPPPIISWLKNGLQLPIKSWKSEIVKGVEWTPFSFYSRSVLRISAEDGGNFTCRAMNQLSSEAAMDQRSFMVYVEKPDRDVEAEAQGQVRGYCAPYNGAVCRSYIVGRGLVWFNISQDNAGGWRNEEITLAIKAELIETLQEPCRSAAESLLCHYAFPDCSIKNGEAAGLPLCFEDCIAIKQMFCYSEWKNLIKQRLKGITIKSRGHFRLPECRTLPRMATGNGNATCTKSGITDMRYDLATTSCVKGNGRYYQGKVNTTKGGLQCQPWYTEKPHKHNQPPNVFPEMSDSNNYCRNGGGIESSPWCYTMDPLVRWQHCDIEKCAENVTDVGNNFNVEVEVIEENTTIIEELMTPTFIALAASVAAATVIVILLIGLICHRLCARKPGYVVAKVQDGEIDLTKLPENSNYHTTGATLHPKLEILEYPRNDIIYIRDIGQGAFGRVFQGKAPRLVPGEEFTTVAVKMLKEDATDDMQTDFEREALILSEFDHPNIVKLFGVCAMGKPMCLLFEFMARGDLANYLRTNSPSNYVVRSSDGSNIFTDIKMSHVEQLSVSKQILSGMIYLSDRKFVHRDLASRNCLMDQNYGVKIADFGLSQKMFLQDYYRGDESDAIPIRWMPLESILHNKYTTESDVWAFGVLLWEIFSFALQPYYGLTNEQVVQFIKEGNTLECPENTPKSVYKVMSSCWSASPSSRPCFRTLFRDLDTIEGELVLIQKHLNSSQRSTPSSPSKVFV